MSLELSPLHRAIIASGRRSKTSPAPEPASGDISLSGGDPLEVTQPEAGEAAQTKSEQLHEYLVTSLGEDGRADAAAMVPTKLSFQELFYVHRTSLEPESQFAGRCSRGCEVVIAGKSDLVVVNRDQGSLCDTCHSMKKQEV